MRRSFEHSFKITQQGATLNHPPAYDLVSMDLDGSLIDVSGSKYFVNKKGANVLITNYDFPENWTKGFPYKSAATIDVFGFTSVPVVSLFQNVDYGNQYFSFHEAQILVNGIEIYEARVSRIVAYSEALTGDNLTKANTWFLVPTEVITNVKWIAPNGSDAAAGTKSEPWQTINKITTSVPTNYTVYIKSGTYISANIIFNASTTISINAIGQVIKKGSSGSYLMAFQNAYNLTFNRFIFDSTNTIANAVASYTNGAVRFNNCAFINEATALVVDNGTTIRHTFYNCVFVGRLANNGNNIFTSSLNFSGNYFKDCKVYAYVALTNFSNNKFLSAHASKECLSVPLSATVIGNYFAFTCSGLNGQGALTCKYNYFFPKSTAVSSITATTATGKFDIKNNTFISNYESVTGNPSFINLQNINSWDIQNNKFLSLTTGIYYHIIIYNRTTAVGRTGKVNHNYCKSNSCSGSIISLNGEFPESDVNDGCEFIGNRIIGQRIDHPTVSSTAHMLFVNGGKNMVIKYNRISHGGLGIVVKNGTTGTAYTSEGVQYNVIEDCNCGVAIGSVSGSMNGFNIFNNTIYHSSNVYDNRGSRGIYSIQNSNHIIVKNNIIKFDYNEGSLIYLNEYSQSNGSIAENNQLSGGQYLLSSETTNYTDLATATAAGKLLNCVVSDPLLNDSLVPLVALSGADLGAGYNTGLDASSVWKTETVEGNIVTKAQPAIWQKGAFIQ